MKSSISPAVSTPLKPAPPTTKVSWAWRSVGIGLELRSLEHLDDPVAQRERIGQGLHADRVLGDALDPERGRLAAERDDQRVVVEPMQVAVAAEHGHHLAVEVDLLDLGRDRPARGPAQLRAQRGDAVARLEHAGADLRQERREEREVLAADEPDLDVVAAAREALEMAGGLDPGEPAAQHQDPMRPRRLGSVDRAHRPDDATGCRPAPWLAAAGLTADDWLTCPRSDAGSADLAALTRPMVPGGRTHNRPHWPITPTGNANRRTPGPRLATDRIGRYHRIDMQQPTHEIFDQFKQQLPDIDPVETQEWIESLDALVKAAGPDRARFIIFKLLKRARQLQVGLPTLTQTRYINTISPEQEPYFPGDEAMELKIRRLIRWNALAMVLRANTKFEGIGGHLSTYASAASLYEVGFNHFFRGSDEGPGDQIFFQGHAAPGIYARAFLEGRLTEENLDHFRREALDRSTSASPSYPHPRLMPEFWQFPTVSMGLGPLAAVYQARFNRYLAARGIADTAERARVGATSATARWTSRSRSAR